MFEYKNCLVNEKHITHAVMTQERVVDPDAEKVEGEDPKTIDIQVCIAYMVNGHQLKFTEKPEDVFADIKVIMKGKNL